jgi:hypothetical protein
VAPALLPWRIPVAWDSRGTTHPRKLELSVRRSSSKRRSWNEAGPYSVMPTSLVASKGSGMVLGSSLACTPAAFVRPNENWPRGERGGDNGVPPGELGEEVVQREKDQVHVAR